MNRFGSIIWGALFALCLGARARAFGDGPNVGSFEPVALPAPGRNPIQAIDTLVQEQERRNEAIRSSLDGYRTAVRKAIDGRDFSPATAADLDGRFQKALGACADSYQRAVEDKGKIVNFVAGLGQEIESARAAVASCIAERTRRLAEVSRTDGVNLETLPVQLSDSEQAAVRRYTALFREAKLLRDNGAIELGQLTKLEADIGRRQAAVRRLADEFDRTYADVAMLARVTAQMKADWVEYTRIETSGQDQDQQLGLLDKLRQSLNAAVAHGQGLLRRF